MGASKHQVTALPLAKAWEGRRASTEHHHAPDANPKRALVVHVVEHRHVLVLNDANPPTPGQPRCRSTHGSNGPGWDYHSVITNRQVVDALPADLAAALGTEKVGKEVRNGNTTPIPDNAGPDPVPVPEQTYTPAPKR